MQQILFFKIGAIGDVLMTTPLVRQVKKSGAEVGYFVGKRSASVLQGNNSIDALGTFDESIFEKRTLKNMFRMLGIVRKLRTLRVDRHYKTIVVLDRHWIFGLLAKLAGFKKRVGLDRLGIDGKYLTHKIYWDKVGREVEHYIQLGEFLGCKPNLDDQSYEYHKVQYKQVHELFSHIRPQRKKKSIGVALGGGNQLSKAIHGAGDCRWRPAEKWKILIKHLLDQGYDVFTFGGPTDRKIDVIHAGYHDLTGRFSLRETIDALSFMDVVVCQESGFMHFSACAGVPVIALAGPTDPQRLFPYHTRTEKYAGEWIWKMSYECYDAYGTFEACTGKEMDAISVQEVYNATLSYL